MAAAYSIVGGRRRDGSAYRPTHHFQKLALKPERSIPRYTVAATI
jgi:hypothetical protein